MSNELSKLFKFGFEIPCNMKMLKALTVRMENNLWRDSRDLAMKQLFEYKTFEFGIAAPFPDGYERVKFKVVLCL
jgi:hypothetical protein